MNVFWEQHCKVNGKTKSFDGTVAGGEMQDVIMQDDDEIADVPNPVMQDADMLDKESSEAKIDTEKREPRADIISYKAAVTGNKDTAWKALLKMGRPLWQSMFVESIKKNGLVPVMRYEVLNLAANKLMLGLPPDRRNYNETTMFGVASMLCRLGVRPRSTSALASRAIANFMAVLGYVDYKREGYISSYASDPILTLGAIKVWYGLDDALEKFILPEFKKLMVNEALDIGDTGDVVARIVLLLAMDKCIMGDKQTTVCGLRHDTFVLVSAFLKILGAEKMRVRVSGMTRAQPKVKKEFHTWLSKWDGWQMGFTHFVQLKLEPNEDTLWYLLGRRAADEKKMDKRKNNNGQGAQSSLQSSEGNSVASASGSKTTEVTLDPTQGSDLASDHGFTLCYRSVCVKTFRFLNEAVVKRLANLSEPMWDPMALVEGDLTHRREVEEKYAVSRYTAKLSEVMADTKLRLISRRSLLNPPGLDSATKQSSKTRTSKEGESSLSYDEHVMSDDEEEESSSSNEEDENSKDEVYEEKRGSSKHRHP